jgi:hypothetical protein
MTAVFIERHDVKPGEKISLAPKAGLLHLFDQTSGQRVCRTG